VHGIRGHPRRTWEDSRDASIEDAGNATSNKRSFFKPFFKSKPSTSTPTSIPTLTSIPDGSTSDDRSTKLFWPEEYLTQDIPDARVWTYGYNADVIGGMFQANNKNSVSQHGRDLEVRVEREIENQVGPCSQISRWDGWADDTRTRSCLWPIASAALSSRMCVSVLLNVNTC